MAGKRLVLDKIAVKLARNQKGNWKSSLIGIWHPHRSELIIATMD